VNAPRLCGHVLLWLGFLSGAFVTVRSTELPERPWLTISWPVYLIALSVAVGGVILLRATKRGARASSEKHAGDVQQMEDILKRLLDRLRAWQADDGRLPVHEVHREIDEHLSDDLALFAELRESMIDAFGLQNYAAVMTEFALGERAINRMWSASADGYIDEVDSCLQRASTHLENALNRLRAIRDR
jgi:hypothetical protein